MYVQELFLFCITGKVQRDGEQFTDVAQKVKKLFLKKCFEKSFLIFIIMLTYIKFLHPQWWIICILENLQISPRVIFWFLPNVRRLCFYFSSLFPLKLATFLLLLRTSSIPDEEFSALLLITFSALYIICELGNIPLEKLERIYQIHF